MLPFPVLFSSLFSKVRLSLFCGSQYWGLCPLSDSVDLSPTHTRVVCHAGQRERKNRDSFRLCPRQALLSRKGLSPRTPGVVLSVRTSSGMSTVRGPFVLDGGRKVIKWNLYLLLVTRKLLLEIYSFWFCVVVFWSFIGIMVVSLFPSFSPMTFSLIDSRLSLMTLNFYTGVYNS